MEKERIISKRGEIIDGEDDNGGKGEGKKERLWRMWRENLEIGMMNECKEGRGKRKGNGKFIEDNGSLEREVGNVKKKKMKKIDIIEVVLVWKVGGICKGERIGIVEKNIGEEEKGKKIKIGDLKDIGNNKKICGKFYLKIEWRIERLK